MPDTHLLMFLDVHQGEVYFFTVLYLVDCPVHFRFYGRRFSRILKLSKSDRDNGCLGGPKLLNIIYNRRSIFLPIKGEPFLLESLSPYRTVQGWE